MLAALLAAFVTLTPVKAHAFDPFTVIIGAGTAYNAWQNHNLKKQQQLIITQVNQNTNDMNYLGGYVADWSQAKGYQPAPQPVKDDWRKRLIPTTSPLAIGESAN